MRAHVKHKRRVETRMTSLHRVASYYDSKYQGQRDHCQVVLWQHYIEKYKPYAIIFHRHARETSAVTRRGEGENCVIVCARDKLYSDYRACVAIGLQLSKDRLARKL